MAALFVPKGTDYDTQVALAWVLKNPAILSALVSNPKTSGVVTSINMSGIPR